MSRACDLYVSNTFHARYRRVEYTLNIQSSKIKKANFTLENLFENFLCDIQSSKIKLKVATRLVSIKKKITKTTERQTNYTEDIS